jgi:hypothetical protein
MHGLGSWRKHRYVLVHGAARHYIQEVSGGFGERDAATPYYNKQSVLEKHNVCDMEKKKEQQKEMRFYARALSTDSGPRTSGVTTGFCIFLIHVTSNIVDVHIHYTLAAFFSKTG